MCVFVCARASAHVHMRACLRLCIRLPVRACELETGVGEPGRVHSTTVSTNHSFQEVSSIIAADDLSQLGTDGYRSVMT